MNFVIGLPKSGDKNVLLVVIDKFTKYYHLLTLAHPYKASYVAQLFLDHVYKLHAHQYYHHWSRPIVYQYLMAGINEATGC
jgi:hypothetical protein